MNEREDFQFPTSQSQRRGNGSDTAHVLGAGVRESLSNARQRIGDTMATAQERSRMMVDSTSGYIQRWPFSAIALAAGVGLLVGWMIAQGTREEIIPGARARWWR